MSRRRLSLLIAAALTATLAPSALAGQSSGYDVTIRRTAYGIPHITAKDYGSLGYGYGHEVASATICTLADTYTTVRAQRSKFFGPNGSYVFVGNGSTVNNLNSDFFFQQINDDKRIEKLMAQPAPYGPSKEVRDLAKGYAAGYNRYLRDVGGSNGISDPTCKGKPWVTPIR